MLSVCDSLTMSICSSTFTNWTKQIVNKQTDSNIKQDAKIAQQSGWANTKARIFLIVDLREKIFRLRVGGQIKNK